MPAPDPLVELITRAEELLRASEHREAVSLLEQADPLSLPLPLLDRALPTLLMAVSIDAGQYEALLLLESIGRGRADGAARGILDTYRAEAIENDPGKRAELAREALSRLGDETPVSQHRALAALLTALIDTGQGLDEELMSRMTQLEASVELLAPVDSALAQRGFYGYQVGDIDGSRTALRELARQANVAGQPLMERIFTAHLATVDIYAGRLDAARRGLDDASALNTPPETLLPVEARARGLLAVRTADADGLQQVLLEPTMYGSEAYTVLVRTALIGFSASLREDWREAHVQLTRGLDMANELGLREPGRRLWIDFDLARAALGIGRVEQALQIADDLDEVARGERALLTGVADRIRGVAEESVSKLESSAAVLAGAGHPDQHALALLELGRALAARGQITRARSALERAGVIVRRTGDVSIRRLVDDALESASTNGRLALLTVREQEVARAAARGATSRQIATASYTSVRTVESQLASVYRKLGVSSRAQLAVLLSDGPVSET